jgi:uncharacterized integral membrane protein (TIGR00697 family)
MKTIWFGVFFAIFFMVMAQFVARFTGLSQTSEVNNALNTLFTFSPRIVLGSIIGFAFAQVINIRVYEWIKVRTKGRFLWLRTSGANIVSQFVDSILFFSIAFFDLPGPLLVHAILVGWVIKVIVVSIGIPLLYSNTAWKTKNI